MLGDDFIEPTKKNYYWYNANAQAYLALQKDRLARINPQDQSKKELRLAIQNYIQTAEDLEKLLNIDQADKRLKDEENQKKLEQLCTFNQKLTREIIRLKSELRNIIEMRGNFQYFFEQIFQFAYNPFIQKFKSEYKNIKDVSDLKSLKKQQNFQMISLLPLLERNTIVMKLVKKKVLEEKSSVQQDKKAVIERINNLFESHQSRTLKIINRKQQLRQNVLEKLNQYEQRLHFLKNQKIQACFLMQKRSKRIDIYNQSIYNKNKIDNDSQISTSEEDRKEAEEIPIKPAQYQRNPQIVLLKQQPKNHIWMALAVWLIFILVGGIIVYTS